MRPMGQLVLLAVAIAMVLATFAAYGVLWWSGMAGRPATGADVELVFRACPEAIPTVEGRLADMGLVATVAAAPGGFTVETVLPADPIVAASVPGTLARPGRVEIVAGDEVVATNADVTEAEPRLDLRMASFVVLRFAAPAAERLADAVRADPRGHLALRLDGVEVATQPNAAPIARGELEFAPRTDDDAVRMRAIAEWAVVADHGPLPCGVEPVPSGAPDTPGSARGAEDRPGPP
jgi:hypothetical protein